jgi:hypothetical protein
MYDYLSIHSDSNFSKIITAETFRNVLLDFGKCTPKTNASFIYSLGDYNITIQGIECDNNGNYGFDSDSLFNKINLIEINIPQGAESRFEDEIAFLAKSIASKLDWQIDWRE